MPYLFYILMKFGIKIMKTSFPQDNRQNESRDSNAGLLIPNKKSFKVFPIRSVLICAKLS